jgi:hypothetical protein
MPSSAGSLPSQLADYHRTLLELKETAQALVDDVSPSVLSRRPAPDEWSVAQVFDHVNTAGWLLLNDLEQAIERARASGPYGRPPFRYGFVSRWFVRAMQPSSGWTFTAPAVFEPDTPETLHPHEAVREFSALQDDLARCVERSKGIDLRRVRVPSPALPLLRISLGAWFEATIAHEERHLDQARDILARVRAASSPA